MVHIRNGKRFNIYAQQEIDGVTYPEFTNAALQSQLGITTVEPEVPVDYTDDTYYRTEQDTAPYVVYEKKSAEQITEQNNARFIMEAKAYLLATDYKMLSDYVPKENGEPLSEIIAKRASARDLVQTLSEDLNEYI